MQTVLDVHRLKPKGTNVLVKRGPVRTHVGRFEIPQAYRDRNSRTMQSFEGVAVAVGARTVAHKFGRTRGWFEPGDTVYFWHLYDWKDKEVVLKDSKSGEEYLVVDESDVLAFIEKSGNE